MTSTADGGGLRSALPGVLVPVVAVALAAVLLAGLFFAARPGTASAATVLERGEGVVAQLADGRSQQLAVGDEVPRGALVVAARDGAVLRTLDRDTWLGGGSAVTVLDGARQELREGLVMVDARRGPALSLATDAADVTVPAGAVSRAEAGQLVRVGSYAGDPLTVSPAGRRATTPVARDYQVQVPRGALPGRVTPLVLTPGDAYERALAPLLVAADSALNDVAAQLDAGGTPALAVRTAADTDVPAPAAALPAGAPGSERALAYLLARAAPDGPLADRYAQVRALRGDGGSWGVVADLVAADVPTVSGLLDELLAPDAALLAAPPLTGPDVVSLVTGGTGSGPATTGSTAPPGAPGPATTPPAVTPPPGEPLPVPPPPDPQTLIGTLVDTVVGLLPSGVVDAPAPDAVPAPSPSPAPLLPLDLPLLAP